MNDVLLTVSGIIDPDLEAMTARGERPVADYAAMARAFDADLLDYAEAQRRTGTVGRLLRAAGGRNLVLALACFWARHRYRVIFTDGEQVGLPLALLFKGVARGCRPRHIMIGHLLSVRKKMLLLDALRLHDQIDCFVVYASWQKRFIEQRWRVAPERVFHTPFMVDAEFFHPDRLPAEAPALGLPASPHPLICSAGLEFRDYPTLVEAVQGLPVQVVIAAASPWSKRQPARLDAVLPDNVTIRAFSQYDLRHLYALSQIVVMPLEPVNFQAGVTAILEAMAMGKPVICTRTPGQTDVIDDGRTGRYVPPGDPAALRAAIVDLLDHPAEAEAMGRRARQKVEERFNLEHYVRRLTPLVRAGQPERSAARLAGRGPQAR